MNLRLKYIEWRLRRRFAGAGFTLISLTATKRPDVYKDPHVILQGKYKYRFKDKARTKYFTTLMPDLWFRADDFAHDATVQMMWSRSLQETDDD